MYIQNIAQAKLDEIEEFRPDKWERLNWLERLEAAQKCENAIAQFEKRPAARVSEVSYLNDKIQKDEQFVAGYYRKDNTIAISHEALRSENPYFVFELVVHEARHAYICHAQANPGFHAEKEVKNWNESHDFVEKTCTDIGNSLSRTLKDEHQQQRSHEQLVTLLHLCQEKQAALEMQAQKQKDEKERDR